MRLYRSEKVSTLFADKVIAGVAQLNAKYKKKIPADWLMRVMESESEFNAKAVNKQPGDTANDYARASYRATGLIQFMPATAVALGTSTTLLYNMSAEIQLTYVFKYFDKYGYWKHVDSFEDLYLATFYPKALIEEWPDNRAFPQSVYVQNRAIDWNKDKILTVGDFRQWALSKIEPAWLSVFSVRFQKKS